MRQFSIFRGIRGFVTVYNHALRWRYMYKEAVVRKRIEILTFYQKHGLEPTQDAYHVSRATLFRWQRALSHARGRLSALDPQSTRPKRVRMRHTESWVVEFIIAERKKQKLGKAKLHTLLKQRGYTKSINTVDRILADLKRRGLVHDPIRYSLHARTGRLHVLKKRKITRLRKPKGDPCIQIDTVTRHSLGTKRYTVTAIHTETRQTHARTYESHSSIPAAAFLRECVSVFPSIPAIQTDNGSEFAGFFAHAAQELNLTHYHIYPRCPDQNAYVERFNRTLDEEFLRYHARLMATDVEKLNEKLSEYLDWYNHVRPHHGLGLLSPMQYIRRINGAVSKVVG